MALHGNVVMLSQWDCVLQMVLKCANIGHLAVDPKTHKRWAFSWRRSSSDRYSHAA